VNQLLENKEKGILKLRICCVTPFLEAHKFCLPPHNATCVLCTIRCNIDKFYFLLMEFIYAFPVSLKQTMNISPQSTSCHN